MTDQSRAVSAAKFAEIAAILQAEPVVEVTAQSVVDRLSEVVSQADGVSLTVQAGRGFETLASTDERAEQADALQYELEQGPCVSAASDEQQVVGIPDLRRDTRWDRWSPRAADLGMGSVLSVQLLADDRTHGALNMYSRTPRAFDDSDTVDRALIYAVHASNALVAARLVTNLRTAITSRHLIGMAQGIVMERYALSEDKSFDLLRRLAESSETKVRDVAAHVVRARTLPESAAGTEAADSSRW